MAGSVRLSSIVAKLEATSGTDSAPTSAADGVLYTVNNLKCSIEEKMVSRDVIRGVFGAADMLPYTRRGNITFSVELQSSNALGTPPEWGDLLIGCGFAETITAATRVEYTPSSSGLKTLTIWAYWNGKLEKFNFCAGTAKFNFKVGSLPTIDFAFQALVSSVTATPVVTSTVTAWKRALAVGAANTSAILFGPTYSAGAFTGGTGYSWTDFQLDSGGDVQDLEMAGTESVAVYNRQPSCNLVADIGAAGIVTQYANMHAGTPTTLGFTHGQTSGSKIMFFAPNAVLTAIDDQVNGNIMLNTANFALPPSAALNDDFRIVVL